MEIKAVVLAGGKSERFGEDKRFFKIDDKTLIEIAIEKIKKIFDDVYIVCDDEEFMRDKLKGVSHINIIEDIEKYKGPLMGIYSFFKRVRKSGFFIPCDMPYLPLEFIEYIRNLALKFGLERMILISEERPLPGFFPKSFLKEIEDYLKRGNSIKGFINYLKERNRDDIYFIPDKELLKFGNPEHYLKNINRKEDLNNA